MISITQIIQEANDNSKNKSKDTLDKLSTGAALVGGATGLTGATILGTRAARTMRGEIESRKAALDAVRKLRSKIESDLETSNNNWFSNVIKKPALKHLLKNVRDREDEFFSSYQQAKEPGNFIKHFKAAVETEPEIATTAGIGAGLVALGGLGKLASKLKKK